MLSIKEAIKEMSISRMEVALKLEVSYETVYKWERDNRIPKGPASILFWRLYNEKRETKS